MGITDNIIFSNKHHFPLLHRSSVLRLENNKPLFAAICKFLQDGNPLILEALVRANHHINWTELQQFEDFKGKNLLKPLSFYIQLNKYELPQSVSTASYLRSELMNLQETYNQLVFKLESKQKKVKELKMSPRYVIGTKVTFLPRKCSQFLLKQFNR